MKKNFDQEIPPDQIVGAPVDKVTECLARAQQVKDSWRFLSSKEAGASLIVKKSCQPPEVNGKRRHQ